MSLKSAVNGGTLLICMVPFASDSDGLSVVNGGDSSCMLGTCLHQTVTSWTSNAAFRQPLWLRDLHGTVWYIERLTPGWRQYCNDLGF
jgi:hypothetical protein